MASSTALLFLIVYCFTQATIIGAAANYSQTDVNIHYVDVGKNGLTFEPDHLQAATGDIVIFQFWPMNHSIAESTYSQPCQPPVRPAIFSGFVPVHEGVASRRFAITINNTCPIWLYCSQVLHDHCQNGQVMVINPDCRTGETLRNYKGRARNATTISPSRIDGGVLLECALKPTTNTTISHEPKVANNTPTTGPPPVSSVPANVAPRSLWTRMCAMLGLAGIVFALL